MLDLGENTSLVSLRLEPEDGAVVHYREDEFQKLFASLDSVRSAHLQHVRLGVHLLSFADPHECEYDLSVPDWATVDASLVRLGREHPQLVVKICVLIPFRGSWDIIPVEAVLDDVVSRIPLIRAQGTKLGIVCAYIPMHGVMSTDLPFIGERIHWVHSSTAAAASS